MGGTKIPSKTEEKQPRALRKRKISKNYSDDNAVLDALLGTEEDAKNIKLKKPDISSLRRKCERTCPALLINSSDAPQHVISTLVAEGFRRPVVVKANANGHVGATRAALGLHLPLPYLSPRGLIKAVGGDHEVPTFDVATQDSGPRMTVKQLADYFAVPPEKRTRLFNVVSFSLADTELADKIDPPEATRQLDLSSQVWPEDDDEECPDTLLYALLGPKGAYTDWHVDMGGSSVWYHLISGCKIFMLAPNTPKNNATFENWSTSEQQTSAFLGDSLEQCQRIVLRAGDTLFLPSGWPHAVSTPEDSFVLGGNFLQPLDFESIVQVYRQEIRLGVQPKFQFPLFRRLLWHAARCAVEKIQEDGSGKNVDAVDDHDGRVSRWERQGLPALLSLLKDWQKEPSAARRVDIPDEIEDADEFLEEMEELLATIDTPPTTVEDGGDAGGAAALGGGSPTTDKVKVNKNASSFTKAAAAKPSSTSDCGTSSSEDDEEEELEDESIKGRTPKDPRRPEKRTKQLASLTQLKEALAARRAIKPLVNSPPKSSLPPPSLPSLPRRGQTGTAAGLDRNKSKVTVITLVSIDKSDHDSGPIYISSSDEDDSGGKEKEERQGASKSKVSTGGRSGGSIQKLPMKTQAVNGAPVSSLIPKRLPATATVNRGLKSPLLPVRKKPTKQQEKKVNEVVYTAPVVLDVQPLGRSKHTQPFARKATHLAPPPSSAFSSFSSERAVALRQIAEMHKLEQDVQREQRLLESIAGGGGGVALKDSGEKLKARVTAQRHRLEMMRFSLEGKILYFRDLHGHQQGPFTSRQLEVLVKAGSCPADAVIERQSFSGSGGGIGGGSSSGEKIDRLSVEEAISLDAPLTAEILKEEGRHAKELKEKESAAAVEAAAAAATAVNQQQQQGVQKKKRSNNRHRPRKEYSEPYFSHNTDIPQKQHQQQQQQQQRPPPSRHQQQAGPSAWDIAAAITQQESDPIWTFKHSRTGEYSHPLSISELRTMFFTGQLVDDIMVHDEDGGVSTSLLTLIGVPRGGTSNRYEIEPYRVQNLVQKQSQKLEVERFRAPPSGVQVERRVVDTKEEKAEPEPFAVTMGRQFSLSARPLLSAAPLLPPPPRHDSFSRYNAPQQYTYNQKGASGSWAAPPPQQQQQQQQPPYQYGRPEPIPMMNATPRPMVSAVGANAVGAPGVLGPMRPATELNQYQNQQYQQRYGGINGNWN